MYFGVFKLISYFYLLHEVYVFLVLLIMEYRVFTVELILCILLLELLDPRSKGRLKHVRVLVFLVE